MNKKTAALLLASAVGAGVVAQALRGKPYTTHPDGRTSLTAGGRLRLALRRQVVKWQFLVGKKPGFPQVAMRAIEQRQVPTAYGLALVTYYWPVTAMAALLPVHVNFHGGGYVLGGAGQDDRLCRYLAHHAGCVVVNVEYVVAPEHPFPAPVRQCYEVVQWVRAQAATLGYDASRLAVGGQSAGGAISAAIALLVKQQSEFSLALQILDYPPLDLAQPAAQKNLLPGRKQVITVEDSDLFSHLYCPCPADLRNPLASPLLANDVAGVAPALVITAEYDLLKTDGNAYAARLHQAGVPVVHHEFAGVDHGFTVSGPVAAGEQAWTLMAAELKKAFAT